MEISNRVTGFASGMDINQQVRDLMRVERQPLIKMEQESLRLQYEMDGYREMNRSYQSFSDSIFDGIIRRSNTSAKEAVSSNESLVSVSASANAEGSYQISNVDNLASAAMNRSQDAAGNAQAVTGDNGDPLDRNGSLWSQLENTLAWDETTVNETVEVSAGDTAVNLEHGAISGFPAEVAVNGENYTVVANEEDLAEGTVYLNEAEGTLQFNERLTEDAQLDVEYTYNEFTFGIETYNEDGEAITEEFTFSGSATLDDVMDSINASEAGVNAFYDEFSGQFSITRSETGEFNPNETGFEMSFSGAFMSDVLHLDKANETAGENASFTLNGIETERRSNQFTENGVEFTLNDTFSDSSVSVSVNPNTEQVKETVMDFVEEYNKMIDTTNEKLNEEYYRDYPPLTEEQRGEMSEREIELWEERSQSGYLRNDDILSRGLETVRRNMYDDVATGENAAFSHLTEIGITTTSDYMDGGKLEVDETRLEEAIQEDSEAVYQLFSGDGDTYEEKGVARRVRESLDGVMDQISGRAGGPTTVSPDQFTIGREMNDLDDQMSNFERRLQQIEERYWDQFTRMEQAIAEANAQAQQMQQQFSSLMG
ncbi:flagellar hook-associated protein 2 [Alteribacillus persepolensis]|uniref:Flagellar hook-associated protein 2 n=1 Tax=Alteribacillus persepolensis TaxID=568899 RepID=A0A1G8AG76_9BACI|nr:flagellar filament capping protein FliD [Alteribacillus persepolensis]SDH19901.1 flagellar hook-associated protein 2 [Alteribacillus persepolensis]